MFRVGLNPYGIAYSVGLQGRGTARANPRALGLDGFLKIAEEIGVAGVEIPGMMLLPLQESEWDPLRARIAARGWFVVISKGPPLGKIEPAIRYAERLGAKVIRVALTTVLCGARAELGSRWSDMVSKVKTGLREAASQARDHGLEIAIENHQDFTSRELMELCEEAGENVGVCLDTGNPLAVGEDPVSFAKRVAPRVRHVHLKDYHVHSSLWGYRLARCAIGDGVVPIGEIASVLGGRKITAAIEPGALESRHVMLLTKEWWKSYPPRHAREFAAVMAALRREMIHEDEDWRTPWERDAAPEEIIYYEWEQLQRSVENLKAMEL